MTTGMSGPDGAPVLEVNDLSVSFRTRRGRARVVNGLSYTVRPGETLAIVGESGSGKSVAALALMGLLPGDVADITGSARFQGDELIGRREEDLRRVRGAGISMVFQDPMTSLNPVLTVGRQIAEALRAHRTVPDDEVDRRAEDLLNEVGIPDARTRLSDYPHQLSGGMRQRVMIAIALAGNPRVLVADEATTALDVTVQAQILDLVARLQKDHDMAVVWITHDLGVVAGIADHVIVMYAGRCVEEGGVDDLFDRPAHPYTRGLLGALPLVDDPRPARDRDALATMPGLPPDPVDLPPGCAFYPRCPVRADARCATEEPPLIPVGRDEGDDDQAQAGHGVERRHRAASFYAGEAVQ